MTTFSQWLESVWFRLQNGEKIDCPFYEKDLISFGFSPTLMAEPFHGQRKDLEYRLAGCRLHAQVMPHERILVHMDKHDPKHSIGSAVCHFVKESTTATFLAGAGILGTLGYLWKAYRKPVKRKRG